LLLFAYNHNNNQNTTRTDNKITDSSTTSQQHTIYEKLDDKEIDHINTIIALCKEKDMDNISQRNNMDDRQIKTP